MKQHKAGCWCMAWRGRGLKGRLPVRGLKGNGVCFFQVPVAHVGWFPFGLHLSWEGDE